MSPAGRKSTGTEWRAATEHRACNNSCNRQQHRANGLHSLASLHTGCDATLFCTCAMDSACELARTAAAAMPKALRGRARALPAALATAAAAAAEAGRIELPLLPPLPAAAPYNAGGTDVGLRGRSADTGRPGRDGSGQTCV
eukprot:349632-Chlamydomonas_euryale.AAC.32